MTVPAGADLDRHDLIDITTTGRVTGEPHRIEIWFAQRDRTIYLLSGGGDRADWVRNLIAHPAVTVAAAGIDHAGTGRIVVDEAEQRRARDALYAKYAPGYSGDLTGWRETALPVAVDLDGRIDR